MNRKWASFFLQCYQAASVLCLCAPIFVCLGVELMVELSGSECPEPVSQQAAEILKLFSIDTGLSSSSSVSSCF